jgi:hypothetical protein
MDLDLEITNYTITDLESFFKLNKNYTEEEIKEKEEELKNKILKSDELSKKKKNDIIAFLFEVKNLLINKQKPIIKHEDPPVIHTRQEEYTRSDLNPVEKRTSTKTLCVDTLFRSNYDTTKSTDYIYKLPLPINNVMSLQLTSFEFPNTIYIFTSTNNTFELTLYNINTGLTDVSGNPIYTTETQKITIPPGNYSSTEFKTIMNNIFINTQTVGLSFLNVDMSIQYNTIIYINNTPYDPSNNYYSPDFYFKINFAIGNQPIYKTAGWMIGFRKETYIIKKTDTYTNIINTTPPIVYNGYLSSESTYGSTIDNYIFLEIDDYHNNFPTNTFVSTNTTSYIGKNILARVVLTSGSNTIITDNASDGILKKREYFGPIKLEKFRIRVLNRYGDVINIQQNDFSFVLELKQLY